MKKPTKTQMVYYNKHSEPKKFSDIYYGNMRHHHGDRAYEKSLIEFNNQSPCEYSKSFCSISPDTYEQTIKDIESREDFCGWCFPLERQIR